MSLKYEMIFSILQQKVMYATGMPSPRFRLERIFQVNFLYLQPEIFVELRR